MIRPIALRDRCAHRVIIMMAIASVFHVCGGSHGAYALTTYHVGNSLTWDSRPDWGLPKLATDAGLSLTTGWHIRCSGSLDHISNNPTDTCVTPNVLGRYSEAFANSTWDAITLQPFSSTNTPSTPRMEYEASKNLIQLARQNPDNLDATFYLYTGWMSATSAGTDFYSAWHDPSPIDPDADLIRNAASFAWVYDELADDPDLADVDMQMIPVGDVLAELDLRMTAGLVPGFSGVEQFYRDDLHMNNLGWFVASNTVLSTLFKINPTGTPTNSAFVLAPGQTETIEITSELGAVIQDAVWDMVRTHSHTGFLHGDLDNDGFVGITDLNLVLTYWNLNFPSADTAADPSGDSFVGIEDLNIVLGNWNAGTPPTSPVPEPASAALLLLGSLAFLRRVEQAMPSI